MIEEVKAEDLGSPEKAPEPPPAPEPEEVVLLKDFKALQVSYDTKSKAEKELREKQQARIQELEAAHAEKDAALRARQEDEEILRNTDEDEVRRLATKRLQEGRAAKAEAAEALKRVERREAQAYEVVRHAEASRLSVKYGVDEAELLRIPDIQEMTIFALEKQTEALQAQVTKQKARPKYEAGEGTASGKKVWTATQIKGMSIQEQVAHSEEILQAEAEGRIAYDR